MKSFTLLTILLLVPFVAADDWDDFTNNLATDLVKPENAYHILLPRRDSRMILILAEYKGSFDSAFR